MKELGINILGSLTVIFPQLIILFISIFYLTKRITIDGILILIGTFIGFLVTSFHLYVMPYLYSKEIIDPFTGNIKIMAILGPIGFFGSLVFSAGLLVLVLRVTKKMNSDQLNTVSE